MLREVQISDIPHEMTTHAKFIKAVSEATGWPLADLRYRFRYLREAGQIKGGRPGRGGSAAAHIDTEAAARLLLGMAGTETATKTVAAVDAFWQADLSFWSTGDQAEDQIRIIAKLPTVLSTALLSLIREEYPEGASVAYRYIRLGETLMRIIDLARSAHTRDTVRESVDHFYLTTGMGEVVLSCRPRRGSKLVDLDFYAGFGPGYEPVSDWGYDEHQVHCSVGRRFNISGEIFLLFADLIGPIEDPPAA